MESVPPLICGFSVSRVGSSVKLILLARRFYAEKTHCHSESAVAVACSLPSRIILYCTEVPFYSCAVVVLGRLLNVPTTCLRISGTDALRQFNTETEAAAQTCHLTQSQDIAIGPASPSVDHKGARRQAGSPEEYQCVRHWNDWTWNRPLGESTGFPSPAARPPKRSPFCALSRRETVHLPLPHPLQRNGRHDLAVSQGRGCFSWISCTPA